MKKTFLLLICLLVCCVAAFSQSVTLTFTAKDVANHYVQLNRVTITNLTKSWQETIYWPDTTLTMQNGTGIADVETCHGASLQLSQNNPNPFTGTTEVSLTVAEDDEVMLDIADVNGKIVGTHRMRPQAGTHQFRVTLSTAGTYIMTARQNGQTSSIKMVCNGGGDGNRIEYTGVVETHGRASLPSSQPKNGPKYTTNNPFNFGDQMEYVGYATINSSEVESQRISQPQGASQTFTLQFTQTQHQLPTVTTNMASNITSSSAMAGGTVTSDGWTNVFDRGVCWSTSQNPTINNNYTTDGSGTGSFTSNMTNLTPGTTYFFRAYATNSVGTAYGEQRNFTTLAVLPTVTTNTPSNITSTTATCGGSVTATGGANVTACGVCWSTSQNPTINNSHTTDGSGTGSFTSNITGLTIGTTYYVRAYATNSAGTAYGAQQSFTTINLPTVSTNTVSNITSSTATCGGNVANNGGATVTARGVCWSTSQNPTINNSHTTDGSGTGSFTSNITGLTTGTSYYIRAYATNSAGIAYGAQQSFTTINLPTVSTNTVSNITSSTATCGGYVSNDGGATVTARGVCWSTSQNPTITDSHTINGSGTGSFTSNMTGLTSGTIYYVRAYATNSLGTDYGVQQSFVTNVGPCPGAATVTDYNNNTYNTIQIGEQCWMKENLRSTNYANGTFIPLGTSTSTTTSYRYNPDGNANNVSTYGYLYNWPAVMHGASSSSANPSGVQGICPNGWHVPSDSEWTQLTNYVRSQAQYQCNNSSYNIAKALASTTGWNSGTYTCTVGNNPSTNNATGFSALPASLYNGSYSQIGLSANFWSATESEYEERCAGLNLHRDRSDVYEYSCSKYLSFSVRCVKGGPECTVTVPTVGINVISSITGSSATCGGYVSNDGGATVTARGVCWSTSPNPTISDSHTADGSGMGGFTSSIIGLSVYNTYYVRAYATNNQGTGYSDQRIFSTFEPCPGIAIVTDIDNNTYNTVQIGNQCWMKENLRTTHYSNGTSIALGSSYSTTTAYRYYPNNNSSNVSNYGYLYNWKAVMGSSSSSSTNPSGVQGICPTGWHVPSDAEWTQMTNYVSSQTQYQCNNTSYNIAKVLASTTGWYSCTNTCAVGNNPSANNATGFSALPAGYYCISGSDSYVCYCFGNDAYFWSATSSDAYSAYNRNLSYNYVDVNRRNKSKSNSFSVRCVCD